MRKVAGPSRRARRRRASSRDRRTAGRRHGHLRRSTPAVRGLTPNIWFPNAGTSQPTHLLKQRGDLSKQMGTICLDRTAGIRIKAKLRCGHVRHPVRDPIGGPARMARLAQFGRAALGWCSIPPCRRCARMPPAARRGGGLCAPCWSKVSFIAPPYCERLASPSPMIPARHSVHGGHCRSAAYGRARRRRAVDDVAPRPRACPQIWRPLDLATTMGQWMARAGRRCSAKPTPWCRCRCTGGGCGRRFNQAAVLAKMISQTCGVPVSHAVKRVRATPQQVRTCRAAEVPLNVRGGIPRNPAAKPPASVDATRADSGANKLRGLRRAPSVAGGRTCVGIRPGLARQVRTRGTIIG